MIYKDKVENLAWDQDRISEAVITAENSDVVILCVGLNETLEGEEGDTGNSDASGDKVDLHLPKVQEELIEKVTAVGKPTIVVLMAGRAIDLNYAQDNCNGILLAWYPGARGGRAIADLLFGKESPSGKLPVTFYKDLEGMPEFTDYSMKNRTYRYYTGEPLYPFGYGLTYGKCVVNSVTAEKVYGQEKEPATYRLAKMNLALRGISHNLGEEADSSFTHDLHNGLHFNYIMANPPFNLSDWGADKLKEDKRWKFGMPPAGNANYAWIQHMIWHLSPNGRMGMVLANGSLSSQNGGEGEIRKNIIEADLVEGIISLPEKLFYTTGIPVCLWFINKNKKQKGKTLFIDARKMGTMATRALRELTDGTKDPKDNDIKKLADTFRNFQEGTLEEEKGFCAIADLKEIEKQDFILTPGRYVGIEEQEDDGEPFEEKMTRLTSELSQMFEKSHELENEIREKLGAIGYEI